MTELYASKKYDAITHPKDEFFAAAAEGHAAERHVHRPRLHHPLGVPRHLERHAPARRLQAGDSYIGEVYNALRRARNGSAWSSS